MPKQFTPGQRVTLMPDQGDEGMCGEIVSITPTDIIVRFDDLTTDHPVDLEQAEQYLHIEHEDEWDQGEPVDEQSPHA